MSKRDVQSAFKLIPIAVFGLPYMGRRFRNFICIYLALFFGRRPSPANWGVVATLLMQHIASHRPTNEKRDGPEGLVAFQYVDDGAFIDSWVGYRPWMAPAIWESSLASSLGTRAVNKEKRRAEWNADTALLLWGNRCLYKVRNFYSTCSKGPQGPGILGVSGLCSFDYSHSYQKGPRTEG